MCSVFVLFVLHIVVYCTPVGGWCGKSPEFSCLLRKFLKPDGLTEEGKCDTVRSDRVRHTGWLVSWGHGTRVKDKKR